MLKGHSISNPIIVVILSGGVGARLWPLSRERHPKPFIQLEDGLSLIQKTYARAELIPDIAEVLTVTNRELFFYTKDEYKKVQKRDLPISFILEPFGRNSAAAIAMASHYVEGKYGKNAIMLVLPSDHLINKENNFLSAVKEAVNLANKGMLVTFGIKPTSPKSEYGYIEVEDNKAIRFVEKPSVEVAKKYLAQGNFFWNSGMFCFSANSIIDEINHFCPKISLGAKHCLDNASQSAGDGWSQSEISAKDFEDIESVSIDYAVFEKSNRVSVVPSDMGWSDIGSWNEFGALYDSDPSGNHIFAETVMEDVKNCIIYSKSKIVAGIGLDNLIIADSGDALLVADRSQAQDLRKIVSKLKKKNHDTYKTFPKTYEEWGHCTVLQQSANCTVKKIEIKPSKTLTAEIENKVSSHIVIVEGDAEVLRGGTKKKLTTHQSFYVSLSSKYSIYNGSDKNLIMVEVQYHDHNEGKDLPHLIE